MAHEPGGLDPGLRRSGEARAQADIISAETFHGLVEVRAAAADGERSWLDGGFGKTGVSGGRGDWRADGLTQAALEWRPRRAH